MDKDIRFSGKKIDDDWKEQVAREKGTEREKLDTSRDPSSEPSILLNFLTSLGVQAMIQLGELAHPETKKQEINLDAAREIIDLLVVLKDKTKGNTSKEEAEFFAAALPELQIKFAQKI